MQQQTLNVTKIFIILIIGFHIGCTSSNENYNEENHKIISTIIDKLAKPVIPPPPEGLSNEQLENKYDSIKKVISGEKWLNQKFTVAINKSFFEFNRDKFFIDTKYQIQFEKLLNNNITNYEKTSYIDLKKIITNRSLKIIESPAKIEYKNNKNLWNELDMVMSFSNIKISEDYNNAALIIGVSRGVLSGYSALVLLTKKEGMWEIIYTKTLTVS